MVEPVSEAAFLGATDSPSTIRDRHATNHNRWNGPLELLPEELEPIGRQQLNRWIWFFLGLGVLARVVRYLLRFPLWEDEGFLASNLLTRGYLDLTGPLECRQVCPLGYLWVQLTVVKLLGFSEYTLRLYAFVTGLAELFLFRHLAGRLIKGTPLLVAIAVFAVAYPGIRYSAEAKPYGTDLFVSLVLMTLAIEWWRSPTRLRWLWALAAAAPFAVVLSYPAVFVAGTISLLVAWVLCRSASRQGWTAWVVYNLLLLGSFAAVYQFSARHQSTTAQGQMDGFYRHGFPPLTQPLKLPAWLAEVHTSDMLAYPFGGHHGASGLTFLCVAVGMAVLIRRRQWLLAWFCLVPLGLNFVAAAMHRYPYGQMVKFQLYLAPLFCLLDGLGAVAILSWRRRGRPMQLAPLRVVLVALALVGMGSIARDVWFPAKSASTQRYRDFARWFWNSVEFDGEAVCLKSDLNLSFSPESYVYGLSSLYLCNQRIYSPRHARGEPPCWERISAEHPLRCVEYYSSEKPYDEKAAAAWLAEMTSRYELVGQERYPCPLFDKRERELRALDYVEVYKFVPKSVRTVGSLAQRTVAPRQ